MKVWADKEKSVITREAAEGLRRTTRGQITYTDDDGQACFLTRDEQTGVIRLGLGRIVTVEQIGATK